MLERLMFLASYGSVDGAVGNMFDLWHRMGFFSYILPFLIIFGLTFLALNSSPFLKDDKKKPLINAVIALAVGLIAIQVPIVSQFFSVVFPNLGIALAILLVIIIGLGIFLPKEFLATTWGKAILFGIAAIIVVIVLVSTAGTLGWSSIQWWTDNWATILAVVVIVGLIAAVVGGIVKSE